MRWRDSADFVPSAVCCRFRFFFLQHWCWPCADLLFGYFCSSSSSEADLCNIPQLKSHRTRNMKTRMLEGTSPGFDSWKGTQHLLSTVSDVLIHFKITCFLFYDVTTLLCKTVQLGLGTKTSWKGKGQDDTVFWPNAPVFGCHKRLDYWGRVRRSTEPDRSYLKITKNNKMDLLDWLHLEGVNRPEVAQR